MNIIVTSHNYFVPSLVLFATKLGYDSINNEEIFFLELRRLRGSDFTLSLTRENFEIPDLIECSIIETPK
jgi:hypothetical protein